MNPKFNHSFTIFPDGESTSLHCFHCDTVEPIGYHPSLDILIERAQKHLAERHGIRRRRVWRRTSR